MIATLTRPESLTVEYDGNWQYVSVCDGAARAEIHYDAPDYYDYDEGCWMECDPEDVSYGIWGVKVVDESQRHRGLGTMLMSAIVAHADQEGWTLWLKCQPHRSGEWIVGFYEQFGFRTTMTATDDNDGTRTMTMYRDRSN